MDDTFSKPFNLFTVVAGYNSFEPSSIASLSAGITYVFKKFDMLVPNVLRF